MSLSELNWSEWFEFNQENINKVPSLGGVFRMHQNMKMMYIGNSDNIQKRLSQLLIESCIADSKRFCFIESPNHEQIKEQVLNDYKNRHEGKMPKCMQ